MKLAGRSSSRVKTYRLPRRKSFLSGAQQLQHEDPQAFEKFFGEAEETPRTKFLKHLPDATNETLNQLIDTHGVKSLISGMAGLLAERCTDDVFDLDNTFESTEESERHRTNADALRSILDRLA